MHSYLKRTVFSIILLFSFFTKSYSQGDKKVNLINYDNRPLHYGFLLAGNYSNYRINHSKEFAESTEIAGARAIGTPSFSLGFITNLRLTDYLDLRALPTVAFYSRKVQYTFYSGEQEDHLFEASMIELPILLKYKSDRRVNNRVYVVGGIKPAIEVGAKKKEKSDQDLRTKSFDLSLELGVGSDFYFELFKFAPEIRFSFGLMNLMNPDNNLFTNSLENMNTYTVTFSFLFE